MSETLKMQAGRAALKHVTSGMKLGIGTGSTAEAFIEALAEAVRGGMDIVGVPTSERTRALCEKLGIPLTTLEETPQLDLTIDGADEIDPKMNLIKGAGGALLREKIVACTSRQMVVIADDSKLVDYLGKFPLPIEVNKFGLNVTRHAIGQVALDLNLPDQMAVRLNSDGSAYETDGGHLIIDASFGRIDDPVGLSERLLAVPGVVEHGLFTGIATHVIVAGETGISTIPAS